MLSIVLASIFWYSVKLVKTYTTVLEVPVRYQNAPGGLQLTSQLPTRLRMKVTGPGHLLLVPSLSIGDDSMEVNLQPAVESGQIDTRQFQGKMTRKLPSEIKVNSIRPEQIAVSFEERIRKRVPIVPQLEMTTAPGYRQVGEVVLSPDSVLLIGSVSALKEVDSWPTAAIQIQNLRGARRFRVQLAKQPQVYFSDQQVTGMVQSQPFTEVMEEVEVQVRNAPLDKTVRLLPRFVRVYYQLPIEEYAAADTIRPRLVVDAAELTPERRYVIPELSNLPDIAKGARIEPPYLRFVLQEKSIRLP